jgi:hypothetical protein
VIEEGSFFKVTCDSPDCGGTLKVMAAGDEAPEAFAVRAALLLADYGWTKAPVSGVDLCRECSPQRRS